MTADRLPDEPLKEIEREEMAATQTADLARLRLHVRKLARIARERHEAILFMRDKWIQVGARACPACLYDNGVFIRRCKLHEESDLLRERNARLRGLLREYVDHEDSRHDDCELCDRVSAALRGGEAKDGE